MQRWPLVAIRLPTLDSNASQSSLRHERVKGMIAHPIPMAKKKDIRSSADIAMLFIVKPMQLLALLTLLV